MSTTRDSGPRVGAVSLRRICPGCRTVPARRWLCRRCAAALVARPPIGPIAPPDGLDRVLVLHRYDPLIRRLVLAGKNGARRDLLDELGRSLGELVATGVDGGNRGRGSGPPFDVVTWIPAGRRAARRRGYDQGRLLALAVAARCGAPARRLIVRRPGPDRIGADRARRLEGPPLRAPAACPARVLLVDDVVTTGASLRAGARVLRGAGATDITAVAIARA